MTKYIFVTGGVVSGLGKGITAASLGRLLKARGFKVAAQKLDPYINVDPGTMSPYQHGEVYVTEDGAETDLDLGHYERFIDEDLNKYSNLTTGKVYWNVLNKERQGDYLGEHGAGHPAHHQRDQRASSTPSAKRPDADVVHHRDRRYHRRYRKPAVSRGHPPGGARGRAGKLPVYPRDARAVSQELGRTQVQAHAALGQGAAGHGHHARTSSCCAATSRSTDEDIFRKIANFCNVKPDCVIENVTIPVPVRSAADAGERRLWPRVVCRELVLTTPQPDLDRVGGNGRAASHAPHEARAHRARGQIRAAARRLSLRGGGAAPRGLRPWAAQVHIDWVDSESVTPKKTWKKCSATCDGILVPGRLRRPRHRGHDPRGAVRPRKRTSRIWALCLGMQIAVIEFARHVAAA